MKLPLLILLLLSWVSTSHAGGIFGKGTKLPKTTTLPGTFAPAPAPQKKDKKEKTGGDVGNGGDPDVEEFQDIGRQAYDWLHDGVSSLVRGPDFVFDLLDLREALERDTFDKSIAMVDQELFVKINGKKTSVDARNYWPDSDHIDVTRSRWQAMDRTHKMVTVIHELLGSSGIEINEYSLTRFLMARIGNTAEPGTMNPLVEKVRKLFEDARSPTDNELKISSWRCTRYHAERNPYPENSYANLSKLKEQYPQFKTAAEGFQDGIVQTTVHDNHDPYGYKLRPDSQLTWKNNDPTGLAEPALDSEYFRNDSGSFESVQDEGLKDVVRITPDGRQLVSELTDQSYAAYQPSHFNPEKLTSMNDHNYPWSISYPKSRRVIYYFLCDSVD